MHSNLICYPHEIKSLLLLLYYYYINMFKEYVDRDSSNVAPVNVISSVPQNQSEMSCKEVECEEMNFRKTDPTCSKFRILTF